jgi:mono/diheme cytochrome c family protein
MWEMPVKHGEIGAMNRKAHFAMGIGLTLTVALGGVVVALTVHPNPVCAASSETSFQEDVYPIFKGRCIDCHQPGGQGYEKSGLDLSTYEGVMKGTKYGPLIVPGDPDTSNLMWLLDWKASPELRMPHGKKKLSTCDRDAIRHWIREGAKNN